MWPKKIFRKTQPINRKERIWQKKETTLTILFRDGPPRYYTYTVVTEDWKDSDGIFDTHLLKVGNVVAEIGSIGLYVKGEVFYPVHRILEIRIGSTDVTDIDELSIRANR